MLQRNVLLTGALAALIGLTVGCEWTGTSSEEAWNDAYSWVNFSGTYRLYNLPTAGEDDDEGGTPDTEVNKTQGLGNVVKGKKAYPFTLSSKPIKAGSLTIQLGDYTAQDQGNETLTGAGIASGTINYATGGGSVTLTDTPGDIDNGKKISAEYVFIVEGTPPDPKKPGTALTQITINQQGNLLTFVDNNGVVYNGRTTGANVPSDSRSAGNVRLNFEVTAANGAKIIGTLSGDWSGGEYGTLANRLLRGTYMRGGTRAELQGASGSISITPRPITSD